MERKIWKWSCKTGMDWIRFNQLFTPFGLVTHILLLCILYWINPCSLKQAKMGAQQWRTAQESLLNLEKNNVAAVDSIVRYVLSRNIIKVSQSRWFMWFLFFFGFFHQRRNGSQSEHTCSVFFCCVNCAPRCRCCKQQSSYIYWLSVSWFSCS